MDRGRDVVSYDGAGPPSPLVLVPRQRGRDDVVRELFEAHYRPLVRLARLMLRDPDNAEDVVQDAFTKLYGRWAALRDPDSALFYLRSCVANGARDGLRRRRAHPGSAPVVVADEASAETAAVRHESYRELLAGVTALPDRQRQVLVLRYYLDLTEAEIAETLHITRGAVKVHATRGLDRLAQRMEAGR